VSTTTAAPVHDHENQGTGREPATQTTSSGDPEIRLLLAFTPSSINAGTLEVTAQPVMVSQEPGCREEVRNLDSIGYDTHPLADLQIRALADRDVSRGETHFWSVQYRECYAIDLRRVAEMHKTLKSLDRALQRLEKELGPPESFPAYLARCAVALRIASFGFQAGDSTGWHDTNEHRWTDAAGMVYRVGDRVARWRSEAP
jgi:hypothetical protein